MSLRVDDNEGISLHTTKDTTIEHFSDNKNGQLENAFRDSEAT